MRPFPVNSSQLLQPTIFVFQLNHHIDIWVKNLGKAAKLGTLDGRTVDIQVSDHLKIVALGIPSK